MLNEVRLGLLNEQGNISLLVLPCMNESRRHQEAKNRFKNTAVSGHGQGGKWVSSTDIPVIYVGKEVSVSHVCHQHLS